MVGHPLDDERFRKETGQDLFRSGIDNGKVIDVRPGLQRIQCAFGDNDIYVVLAGIIKVCRVHHFGGVGSLFDGEYDLIISCQSVIFKLETNRKRVILRYLNVFVFVDDEHTPTSLI